MARKRAIKESQLLLGKNIERMRVSKDMTRMQIARKIRKNEQDIAKYESGELLVPLPVLQNIAAALDEPIQKKIIRRISFVRKWEVEKKVAMESELIDLYNEAIPLPEEE